MKNFYGLFICLLITTTAGAQIKKRNANVAYNKQNNKNEEFLQKQWWLGLKAGVNISEVVVEKSYAIISPTNYPPARVNKSYKNYKDPGSTVMLEFTFYIKGFSVSFQPTYQHSRFTYTNFYQWTDNESATNRVDLHYKQQQKLEHAILPLIVKYEIIGNKFRPYVQLGVYSAHLINANKAVTISGIDYAAGGSNEFKNETITLGAKDLFAKDHWGLLGGIGAYYNIGNIRLNLDVSYRHGMSNISSTLNRYGNDRLSGVGDAMDDLTLNTLTITAGTLFPLRFLSNGFKSLDQKK